MDSQRISIVIVDDHAILLSGLKLLLEGEEGLEVVGMASTAQEARQVVGELQPDCCLLDISLPDGSGLDLIEEFRSISPQTRVLMLTMHEDQRYLREAMDLGAAGFLLKKALDSDLIYAIGAVMRGECYIHPSLMRGLLNKMEDQQARTKEEALWATLSAREREVMRKVAQGYTSKEIAQQCCLSDKTVATYRSRAMTKLGLENRAALVALVRKLGLM